MRLGGVCEIRNTYFRAIWGEITMMEKDVIMIDRTLAYFFWFRYIFDTFIALLCSPCLLDSHKF